MNPKALAGIIAGLDAVCVGFLVQFGQFGSAAFMALVVMIICAYISSTRGV